MKTRPNAASARAFIDGVEDLQQRKDAKALLKLMREIAGHPPRMWGDSVVGFGSYHYKYASGREGDWFLVGFSPRKRYLTLYLMCDLAPLAPQLARLGKHKTGVGCVYIRRLSDVDAAVLRKLVELSVDSIKQC